MLSLSSSNRITFNVNVSGTAASATVRCVLGEYPALMFSCTKLSNTEYEVIIDLPADTKVGPHPFKIEVLLNGRLFTPINTTIEVNTLNAPSLAAPVNALSAPVNAPVNAPVSIKPAAPKAPESITPLNILQTISKTTESITPVAPIVPISIKPPASKAPESLVDTSLVLKEKTKIEIPKQKKMNGLENLSNKVIIKKPLPKSPKMSLLSVANKVESDNPTVIQHQNTNAPKIYESNTHGLPVIISKGGTVYK